MTSWNVAIVCGFLRSKSVKSSGCEAVNGLAVLIHRDDIDLDEINGRAKRRPLLRRLLRGRHYGGERRQRERQHPRSTGEGLH